MNESLALIVDDEPDIRELLALTLARMDIDSVTAENLSEARKLLEKDNYFLCLADMRLPDGDGIELVEFIQKNYPSIPVAVITAYGNMEGAVNTLKAGAFDYVSKPVDLHMLRGLVSTALKLAEQTSASTTVRQELLGESSAILDLRQTIKKLARSQAPVFISGGSGTGKELVARLIHEQGARVDQPFVAVNCGAIPTELMESEFFGHKKGSFSGAIVDKLGLFQAADGGTLFLDEVAELPLHMQVKLLRAIQEKAVRPIGEQHEMSVDVRILSASHKDLQQLVHEGEFRQDLFYRINVIEVNVPNLQERAEDILIIADNILERLAIEHQIIKPNLSKESLTALQGYHFPGNVRELENILERALTLCEEGVINPVDLRLPNEMPVVEEDKKNHDLPLDSFLDEQEKHVIMAALEKHKWNRTAAAKELGITFRALRYRLKKLGIE